MRKTIAVLLAALSTAVTLAVTAQPASAASPYLAILPWERYCATPGYVCAWYAEGSSDGGTAFYSDAWDWGAIPAAYKGINNSSSSWENHGTSSYGNVRFFANPGGTGTNRCLRKGYAADYPDGIDNVISANVWKSTCSGYTQFSNQYQVW